MIAPRRSFDGGQFGGGESIEACDGAMQIRRLSAAADVREVGELPKYVNQSARAHASERTRSDQTVAT